MLHVWLNEREVVRWYSKSRPTLADVRKKYGPRILGRARTRVHVAEVEGAAVGIAQTYRLEDYPSYAAAIGAGRGCAGLDYFIGEAQFRGRGLARRIIDCYVREIVLALPGIGVCVSSTAPDNLRSIRALERAGFGFARDVQMGAETEHIMVRTV